MKTIPLTKGKVALVDDEDFERVILHKWCAAKRGQRHYVARDVNGSTKFLHWFIFGEKGIDHRDGDGLNNQRYNLRKASRQQNLRGFQRKRPGVTSTFRGVSWDKRTQKWKADIKCRYKQTFLGRFSCEKAAARAYDVAAKKLFGEFAAPNFP